MLVHESRKLNYNFHPISTFPRAILLRIPDKFEISIAETFRSPENAMRKSSDVSKRKVFLSKQFSASQHFYRHLGVTESSKCYTNRWRIFLVLTNKIQVAKQIYIYISVVNEVFLVVGALFR